jgi:hypothetical protein
VTKGELARPDLNELDWSDERRSEPLLVVFNHSVGLASEAEAWYRRERPPKSRWGRALRVGAIVLAGVAAVLPILTQISTNDGEPTIAPGWAAVALAAAATLVALDRYFGFSSGWMRFMTAELKLTHLRHDFEYAWQAARATAHTPASEGEVAAMLALARGLVLAVDDAIADETLAWTTEFRSALQRAEQSLERPDRS